MMTDQKGTHMADKPNHILLEVIRGSQAHGLAKPGADLDTGFVYARDTLDYFKLTGRPEKETWTPGDGDDDARGFEIGLWFKDLLYGNPNHFEFLWAPVVQRDYFGAQLRDCRDQFWGAKEIMEQCIGYAKNKRNVMLDPKTFDRPRQAKFATAIIRVLTQARVLLKTGHYPVDDLANWVPETFETLKRIKYTEDWSLGEVVDLEAQLVRELRDAYQQNHSVKPKEANWDLAQEIINNVRYSFIV